tara:strand:+ start:132 stop:356 length:225 start_codon:yes stop_codon:yes gene_type:complete
MLEKHDLIHELPEYREQIHEMKLHDKHFAKLFAEYHEVHRIESGAENTSDDFLEGRKKARLRLKDALLLILKSN